MKDRVSLLASRIADIEQRYSEREIREALKLLQHKRAGSPVQAFLLEDHQTLPKKKTHHKRKRKPIEEERSKAVLDLEHKDPGKYTVLSEFDSLLRRGSVLSEVLELKTLGKSLSKSFSTKNSRREAISKLMKVLSEKPLSDIKQIIANVLATEHHDNDPDSDYYKLAQFIITGKTPPSRDQHRI